jgi:hypothetical protein
MDGGDGGDGDTARVQRDDCMSTLRTVKLVAQY